VCVGATRACANLFLSADEFLLDQGVRPSFLHSDVLARLRAAQRLFPHISVVFVKNIGPHRKLLPLLAHKWTEQCVIVTVDDHLLYPPSMLSSLLTYDAAAGGGSVVARRARRLGLCSNAPPFVLAPYTRAQRGLWPETRPARQEMLMLPTGTGGVLYRPSFFHPIVFDDHFRNLTVTGDDLLFRLATLAMRVPVVTSCSVDDTKYTCPTDQEVKAKLHAPTSQDATHVYGGVFDFVKTDFNAHPVYDRSALMQAAAAAHQETDWHVVSTGNAQAETGASRAAAAGAEGAGEGEGGYDRQVSWNGRAKSVKRRHAGGNGANTNMRQQPAEHHTHTTTHKSKPNLRTDGFDHSSIDRRALKEVINVADERKKVSLASVFNNKGGNTVMWEDAVGYLRRTNVLDFKSMLQEWARRERLGDTDGCLLSSAVVREGAGQGGVLGRAWDSTLVKLQDWWDHECGINTCHPEE